MSSLVSVGTWGVDRVPFAGTYRGLFELRSFNMYEFGGAATTEDEMSWYIVLWS